MTSLSHLTRRHALVLLTLPLGACAVRLSKGFELIRWEVVSIDSVGEEGIARLIAGYKADPGITIIGEDLVDLMTASRILLLITKSEIKRASFDEIRDVVEKERIVTKNAVRLQGVDIQGDRLEEKGDVVLKVSGRIKNTNRSIIIKKNNNDIREKLVVIYGSATFSIG